MANYDDIMHLPAAAGITFQIGRSRGDFKCVVDDLHEGEVVFKKLEIWHDGEKIGKVEMPERAIPGEPVEMRVEFVAAGVEIYGEEAPS